MSKRTVTVTAPDDSVHTRQTERPYSHAVLVESSNAKLYATQESRVEYLEDQVKRLETMSSTDSQINVRDHNLVIARKSLNEAVDKLGEMDCVGTTWGAFSFHGKLTAALKQMATINDKIHVYGYESVIVQEVN